MHLKCAIVCNTRYWPISFLPALTAVTEVGFCGFHVFVGFLHDISITDATGITKHDVEMFHDHSWKTPRTCSSAVMPCDSCVDFGTIYVVCLFVYLTLFLFLLYCLLSLCIVSYLFTSLLGYFLTYLSTPSWIDPFCLQTGGRRRQPNLALVLLC